MTELRDELYAAPEDEWQHVPITVNHHKWWLRWYRFGDNGEFFFAFVSPEGRMYSFYAGSTEGGGRLTDADVMLANGDMIASYYEAWGDSRDRLDAVLRLTPRHILDRLHMLLDAIG